MIFHNDVMFCLPHCIVGASGDGNFKMADFLVELTEYDVRGMEKD